MAIAIFLAFVGFVLGMSFYMARKTKSASGYFAAGGTIHWGVNGIAFAGDYLSAASFLGICGMIATSGYDGFLYSIGYLAGWIVALFVVAEPMKRLGKYTFTDALDAKFNSRGIKLTAAISTLVVSIFYLIPQMVGAGVLVEPLLGLPHYVGVIMVGAIVITIVATAGMTSTTYVQFLKGGLLIIFSTVLVIAVLMRGLETKPDQGGKVPFYEYKTMSVTKKADTIVIKNKNYAFISKHNVKGTIFVKLVSDNKPTWWNLSEKDGQLFLNETQSVVSTPEMTLINGTQESETNQLRQVGNLVAIKGKTGEEAKTGSVGAFEFLSILGDPETKIKRWKKFTLKDGEDEVTIFASGITPGNKIMRPGLKFKVEGTPLQKLDFLSLMLALFCGTAALPHILIRYYTVPTPADARKSTIVAIAAIGFFYILTMYMGLGAMISSVVNPLTNNMSAPLLARSYGTFLFAIISAIAFATVLGTVSGLIIASSGAVAHDLMDRLFEMNFNEKQKVFWGKVAAFAVGIVAIILGIWFRGMNVSFLVGIAFAVAASANLPAIIMLLFWDKTTAKGIAASITVGIIAAVGIILLSPSMYTRYGLDPATALVPLNNPGIISIPLSFITLVIVSLFTQKKGEAKET
ncbi:MAG: cation acetate symporter [Elusimicrobiota bacterium]|nr:cation acetate symporter [Elusimicrobiota bacterium]